MLEYVKLIFAVVNSSNEVMMLNTCGESNFIESGWFSEQKWDSEIAEVAISKLNDIVVDGNYEFEFESMYTGWRVRDAAKGSVYIYVVRLEDPAFIPLSGKYVNVCAALELEYGNTNTTKVLKVLKQRFDREKADN